MSDPTQAYNAKSRHYGESVYVRNAREALLTTADYVMSFGETVTPRGLETRELRHFTVVVNDPTDWHCSGINAKWSPRIAAAEGIQLIAGVSRPKWLIERMPRVKDFLNASGTLDGAYGPRIAKSLAAAVQRLKRDHDTRQAVVPIYDFEDTLRAQSKDYPCTLTLHFFIRESRLDLDVSMRSNDVNWGFKHDLSQFMILQCTIARLLDLDTGIYTHTSNSMHLYETSFDWAEDLNHGGLFEQADIPRAGMSSGSSGHPQLFNDLTAHALTIMDNRPWIGAKETGMDMWLRETLRVSS